MRNILWAGAQWTRSRLSNTTPFTFRDSLTYLEWLRSVTAKVQELTGQLDDVINAVNTIRDDTETNLNNLHDTMQREWTSHGEHILAEAEQIASGGVALNPTNGRIDICLGGNNNPCASAADHTQVFSDSL